MKGVVFTEFLEMVDREFGPEVTERILDASQVPSGGAYTAVGTYDHGELLSLVRELSADTGIPGPELVRDFGQSLFRRFVVMYPVLFVKIDSMFDFLARVDEYVHVEVLKLYPDAELPQFAVEQRDERRMTFVYRSTRPFGDFAEGLILGCAEHYRQKVRIERETVPAQSGSAIRFLITRID